LVAGHYQPLADNVAIAATSDQPCLLQSTQKASETDYLESASLRSPIEAGLRKNHSPGVSTPPEIDGLCPRFQGDQLAHCHSA